MNTSFSHSTSHAHLPCLLFLSITSLTACDILVLHNYWFRVWRLNAECSLWLICCLSFPRCILIKQRLAENLQLDAQSGFKTWALIPSQRGTRSLRGSKWGCLPFVFMWIQGLLVINWTPCTEKLSDKLCQQKLTLFKWANTQGCTHACTDTHIMLPSSPLFPL